MTKLAVGGDYAILQLAGPDVPHMHGLRPMRVTWACGGATPLFLVESSRPSRAAIKLGSLALRRDGAWERPAVRGGQRFRQFFAVYELPSAAPALAAADALPGLLAAAAREGLPLPELAARLKAAFPGARVRGCKAESLAEHAGECPRRARPRVDVCFQLEWRMAGYEILSAEISVAVVDGPIGASSLCSRVTVRNLLIGREERSCDVEIEGVDSDADRERWARYVDALAADLPDGAVCSGPHLDAKYELL